MENLWAPWRMNYIKSDKTKECIFCTGPQANDDMGRKLLYRGELSFVIINIYPYSNGHLMVSPYRHLSCLTDLGGEELAEIGLLTQKSMEILRASYHPDGFNVGYNIGKSGGAGFEEHIHCHIVPRWTGDTNFMPVLADTKVHPEHIEATFQRLYPVFQELKI
ncbi:MULTISPECIES: HIT family protein [unclassified Nitrospina]|uniref:HIT family protein n=1 Tax=unclassified Nitrospina TaxID=2638683 RepID=UPI003F997B5D